MTLSDGAVWAIIVGLGIGTFAIRFSFLGLIGDRNAVPHLQNLLDHLEESLVELEEA